MCVYECGHVSVCELVNEFVCESIGETDVCECGLFVFMWHVCKYIWCVVGLVCGEALSTSWFVCR